MSNPYEQLIKQSARPLRHEALKPAPNAPKRLAQLVKKKPVPKPPLRFNIRPRFRFDLPSPPLDPKMLLGCLSTSSYANPYFSELEQNFRPVAIPSDPTHGLHANLVETSIYQTPANLTTDDDVLVQSIMSGRSGRGLLNGASGHQASQSLSSQAVPKSTDIEYSPWMRRMGYDEYTHRDSSSGRQSLHTKDAAAKRRMSESMNDPKVQDRRRRLIIRSFEDVHRNLKHPDRSKAGKLKPVSIAPILPDLSLLGEELIAYGIDKDEVLTLAKRKKEDPKAFDEAIRTTATVSVAERQRGQADKKYVACYTPSDKTLMKRKRKREEDGEDERESKKIHLVDNEAYQWVGEYSIREGSLGDGGRSGKPSRACFAAMEHVADDGKSRVVCLSRIGTSWKLARRPQTERQTQLGKEGLKIRRSATTRRNKNDLKELLSGAVQKNPQPRRTS